ncbi:MAG TPA: hypothetical protein PLQ56_24530 [Aggregatilineales bacterium]|nr:hypothetical protein [Anaerolineae bacterium]HUN09793.1 hypothetical protein [Aggregatilineales bacterium]
MLKTFLRLLFVVMAGMLAACASAAITPTAPPAATTPLPPDDTGSAQAATPVMGMGGRLYAAQDLSIIANTGRPQFLNAYADW